LTQNDADPLRARGIALEAEPALVASSAVICAPTGEHAARAADAGTYVEQALARLDRSESGLRQGRRAAQGVEFIEPCEIVRVEAVDRTSELIERSEHLRTEISARVVVERSVGARHHLSFGCSATVLETVRL